MASIKEATASAIAFANNALGPERTRGIRLEEVESTTIAGKDAWLITLSMINPDEVANSIAAVLGNSKRDYKIFAVLKHNGEVHSMKIREMADA